MENDQEAMQAAFQEFMLSGKNTNKNSNKIENDTGGGNGKKKKKGSKQQQQQQTCVPAKVECSHPFSAFTSKQNDSNASGVLIKQHQLSVQEQKLRKKYWQIIHAFRKTLKEDWNDVDNHIDDVIASIINLRERIQVSSKQLFKFQQEANIRYNSNSAAGEGFGYRKRQQNSHLLVVGHLTKDDVELALSHGLIQHEKMLAGVRRLMASLDQAQEALGRRFDELLTFHLEVRPYLNDMVREQQDADDSKEDLLSFADRSVHWCQQVHKELAKELYRKQCLVKTLFDSVSDGLLYQEDSYEEVSPLKIAKRCHQKWHGESKKDRLDLENILSFEEKVETLTQ